MKQFYLHDENGNYLETNFYEEKPNNSVEFPPTIENPEHNAILNIDKTEWICKNDAVIIIPEKVTDIQFISQLALEGISEDSVISIIETLPEPNRTIAKVSFERETEFHRNNPLMELVRKAFQMNNEQLDQIFINASKITNK